MTELAVLLILLVLSGFFSGSETALVALSIGRVEGLVKEGRRGAHALHSLKKDSSRMLTTILIGNNLVNIGASVLATVVATRWFGSAGPGIAVGVLTILVLIFGEITPKSLATRYAERISLVAAPPLLVFMRLIYPVVWVFGHFTTWVHGLVGKERDPTITESELISMLGHGEQEGTIEHGEREIIERVFSLNDLMVRDVMTPMNEVFRLAGDQTVEEALQAVTRNSYSRIPLYAGEGDNLYKVLYLRDLLAAVAEGRSAARLDEIAHTPLFVSQYQTVTDAFKALARKKRHFSIVVDEFGSVRGVATLEDLLEELVGEIYDESDAAPDEITHVSEHELVVDGAAELRTVEEFFGIDLPGKPTDSVALWVLAHAGGIPERGARFSIDGLDVRVVEVSPRSIDRVSVRRSPSTQGPA
ncbi:MAG: hemolysin family protein [Gammaproteobacteria bacterium]|jgi:CBS domain containing-hemolysin-like protein